MGKFVRDAAGSLRRVSSLESVGIGPNLEDVWRNSKWATAPNDEFPSDQCWSDFFERLLLWFKARFQKHYSHRMLSRLRDDPRKRDETFAEIIAAYFIEKTCGYPIVKWEPAVLNGGTLDFSFMIDSSASGREVFAEGRHRAGLPANPSG